MGKGNKIRDYVGGLLIGLLFTACTSLTTDKDWTRNGKVRLVLDWGTRAAHTGVFDYYFYADGNPVPLVRRGDASGYEGTIPQGHYGVVVCNPDGINLDLSMNSGYSGARAVARSSVFSKGTVGVISQPGNLYGTGEEEVVATATVGKAIVLSPVCLIKEVTLNIRIEGGGEVTVVSGELSGIPPEVCIPTGEPCEENNASVCFSTEVAGINRYTASLSLFGLRPGNKEAETSVPANLSLTVEQKDGQSFVSHTDVTDQVNEAVLNGLAARIELDMTVRPLETGGYTIEVTGWHEGTAETEGTAGTE
ncbi:DUF5119 domain-containing protein [Parabacteroides sp. TM07-1AC]|uniref:DUF5119 domain-containing protein n=1 Tax=Parabacteroides sp. TM07-1AC TaxID=2292363 RepID=UPI000EFFA2D7|nr:DUF5119 domain-containing protein [Parabacteroides sp. TM07-1AC]RHU31077.1 DUF5119 domain-containing protein [Parabacteroides sp. TM07-1AC]